MIVSMWMTREVVTVTGSERIDQAAELLVENRIRRLPVVQDYAGDEVVVGLLSKTDLLHAYPANVNPLRGGPFSGMEDLPLVSEVMSAPVIQIEPAEPLEVAAELMRSRKVGALPVVAEGELVGIITESDIFKAFASLLTGGENPVRVTFDGLDEGLEQFAESVAQAARGSGMILASLISFEWKGRQRAVARAVGPNPEDFISAIRNGGYRVLSIQKGSS
jgi:acetoin utilization protein AcuB